MHDTCTHTVCIDMIQTLYKHDNYKVVIICQLQWYVYRYMLQAKNVSDHYPIELKLQAECGN